MQRAAGADRWALLDAPPPEWAWALAGGAGVWLAAILFGALVLLGLVVSASTCCGCGPTSTVVERSARSARPPGSNSPAGGGP